MKISKVKHTRSAVSAIRDEARVNGMQSCHPTATSKGILYHYPLNRAKYKRTTDLSAHFDEINKNAKELYSILNSEGKNYGKVQAELRNKIRLFINEIIGYNDSDESVKTANADTSITDIDYWNNLFGSVIQKQMDFLCGITKSDYFFIYHDQEEPQTDKLVDAYLRKSLRRKVPIFGVETTEKCDLLNVASQIIKALCISEKTPEDERHVAYKNSINSINPDELRTFLLCLNLDYTRLRQKNLIIASIEKQKVKAEVVLKDGEHILRPSFADHSKKRAIFDFMREYASGNEEARTDMLCHMRELIVLYVCGADVYDAVINTKNKFTSFSYLFTEQGAYQATFNITNGDYTCEKSVFSQEALRIFGELKTEASASSSHEAKEKAAASDHNCNFNGNKTKLKKSLQVAYNNELVRHYQEALKHLIEAKTNNSTEDDILKTIIVINGKPYCFWLDFIEQEVKGLIHLSKSFKKDEYKNNAKYLCGKVWKRWTAYMAEKYIDLGKAVYHFAMPDMPLNADSSKMGIVRREFHDGLTSFDYERIKAVENMERSVSVAVSFALNNLSRSVMKAPLVNNTDVLSITKSCILEAIKSRTTEDTPTFYTNPKTRILRYFGGASLWENLFTEAKADADAYSCEADFFIEIRNQLEILRNGSYHYTQQFSRAEVKDSTFLEIMLKKEKEWLRPIIEKKYYSNNTYRFYDIPHLNKLVGHLYSTPAVRGDQVPAFRRLYNCDTLYKKLTSLSPDIRTTIKKNDVEIFKGTVFFLFKEIYYYDFLKDNNIAKCFRHLVECTKTAFDKDEPVSCENERAFEAFYNRINALDKRASLGEIAQTIMTDYNLQNQQKEASLTESSAERHEKEKYKSFPMLLYLYMREAFFEFITKNEKYTFLLEPKTPVSEALLTEESFCDKIRWTGNMMFHDLSFIVHDNITTAPWYVLGHMIPPTHLNHLSGAIRSYVRYIKDINTRKYSVVKKCFGVSEDFLYFKKVLLILEFCRFFCGRTSDIISDYYYGDFKYQFASDIFEYVDYDDVKKYINDESITDRSEVLSSFCKKELDVFSRPDGTPQTIGLYHDLNRNLVLASLYGTDKIIRHAITKVTVAQIMEYYRLKYKYTHPGSEDKCDDIKKMYESAKQYEQQKNRIELVNVKIYSDILNDLMTQLISWSYFRERDKMYMELGMNYVMLFYGNSIRPSSLLRKIQKHNVVNIEDGAILYQIVAMNTYKLPFYKLSPADTADEGTNDSQYKIDEARGMYSKKHKLYEKYLRDFGYNMKEDLYFFENVKDADAITDLRNYIDHAGYFVNAERSILSLYSDIFNMFFSYSVNFRKSVSFILPNILSRYFVQSKVAFAKDTRPVSKSNGTVSNNTGTVSSSDSDDLKRTCAKLELNDFKSYKFTIKPLKRNSGHETTDNDGNNAKDTSGRIGNSDSKSKGKDKSSADSSKATNAPIEIDARDIKFLEDLKKILYYSTKQSSEG